MTGHKLQHLFEYIHFVCVHWTRQHIHFKIPFYGTKHMRNRNNNNTMCTHHWTNWIGWTWTAMPAFTSIRPWPKLWCQRTVSRRTRFLSDAKIAHAHTILFHSNSSRDYISIDCRCQWRNILISFQSNSFYSAKQNCSLNASKCVISIGNWFYAKIHHLYGLCDDWREYACLCNMHRHRPTHSSIHGK